MIVKADGVRPHLEIPMSCGRTFLIDDADWSREVSYALRRGGTVSIRPSDLCWSVREPLTAWHPSYVVSHVMVGGKRRTLRLHRVVMSAALDQHIDHINGNALDNRRCNLRVASRNQNMWNTAKRRELTSRFKGVSWHKRMNKWQATIRHMNKQLWLGLHPSESAAALAYNEAARRLFGEFARLNEVTP